MAELDRLSGIILQVFGSIIIGLAIFDMIFDVSWKDPINFMILGMLFLILSNTIQILDKSESNKRRKRK